MDHDLKEMRAAVENNVVSGPSESCCSIKKKKKKALKSPQENSTNK